MSNSFTNPMNKKDQAYCSNKIKVKLKQLSQNSQKKSSILPNIYAKANELNRRLSVSNSIVNNDNELASSSILSKEFNLDNMNEKEKDNYLKTYRTRKRSIIVPKYLEEDMKLRFEQVKYSNVPSRRQSYVDSENMNNISTELDNDYNFSTENIYEIFNRNSKFSQNDNLSVISNLKHKSPRFGSTLSKDGQYALLMSLEDTIVKEIETAYPELRDKIPRTTTAQYRKNLNETSLGSEFTLSSTNTQNNNSNNFNNTSEENMNSDLNDSEPKDIVYLNNELKKKLLVTHQIDSAMDILDNLRMNNQKLQNKKIQFNNKVNYSDKNYENKFKRPPIYLPTNKSRRSSIITNLDGERNLNRETRRRDLRIDPIIKYSEWKSVWIKQLENI